MGPLLFITGVKIATLDPGDIGEIYIIMNFGKHFIFLFLFTMKLKLFRGWAISFSIVFIGTGPEIT